MRCEFGESRPADNRGLQGCLVLPLLERLEFRWNEYVNQANVERRNEIHGSNGHWLQFVAGTAAELHKWRC